MKIVALAGGVGGAKLADGLASNLAPGDLTVIVNVGDDFDYLGMRICPDLDTVCYTLAGLANPTTGWGRADESWTVYENLVKLGGPDWFHLGDKDIATHLERTHRLNSGEPLSAIIRQFCARWGVASAVAPISDQKIPTIVQTKQHGNLAFQDYFVRNRCEPEVTGFIFERIESAQPAPGVLQAIREADYIVLCPSNPYVSIAPILGVPGVLEDICKKTVVAVSPIIGGEAVKGPAAKMFQELGLIASATAVAMQYKEFVNGFVLDVVDAEESGEIRRSGIIPYVTDTMMYTIDDRKRLAAEVLQFCRELG